MTSLPGPRSLVYLHDRCEMMLPIVDIGEAILEVMSWEPGFFEAFSAASGNETRLSDLDVTIADGLDFFFEG